MAEVSPLTKQIDQNLLECGICLERYKNPRGLPCLHSFCHECLERWCKDKKQVACPICMKPTLVPQDGVSGFPTHFLVNKLQETLDMEKLGLGMKEDNLDDISCSNCNLPGKKATVHCLDCKEFFCEACHASHNSFTAMKQHKVLSAKDILAGNIGLSVHTREDNNCEEHEGEAKRFFCETCNRLVCGDCIVMKQHDRDHNYLSLKDASKKYASKLTELTEQHGDLEKKCQEAIQKTQNIEKKLARSVKEANTKLDVLQREYMQQVEAMINKHKADINTVEIERVREIGYIKEQLQIMLAKIQEACELGRNARQMDSDYDILSVYSTLSASLQELNNTDVVPAEKELGHVEVSAFDRPEIKDVVFVSKKENWVQTGQWNTKHLFPTEIVITAYGDIVIQSSYASCLNVYSNIGDLKHTGTIKLDSTITPQGKVAITPDNRYIFPGMHEILFYDRQGNWLKSTNAVTYDVNNKLSPPTILAVDSRGRIIAGLEGKTISIHHGDGHCISKFATTHVPYDIAVTAKGDIIALFKDTSIQVMDYSGNNVRTVQPPYGVHKWNPISVCCSKQCDIFVLNEDYPTAVYRYTANGDQCLGSVNAGCIGPLAKQIAITEDGQELFILNFQKVQIFQRQ